MDKREHIITGVLRNKPGVLEQVAECFRRMDVNIQSIAVAPTQDVTLSHITIVTEGHGVDSRQIQGEVAGRLEIIEFHEVGKQDIYERELALLRVRTEAGQTARAMQTAEVFRAQILGVGRKTITFEIAGSPERVLGFIRAMEPFGIEGVARSGRTAIAKEEVS
jgi:acetolactate synthase I/III small subunit